MQEGFFSYLSLNKRVAKKQVGEKLARSAKQLHRFLLTNVIGSSICVVSNATLGRRGPSAKATTTTLLYISIHPCLSSYCCITSYPLLSSQHSENMPGTHHEVRFSMFGSLKADGNPSATANHAFDNVTKRFLDSLPEHERQRYSPCASAEDLLDSLKKLEGLTQKQLNTRFGRTTKCIHKLNSYIKPYFGAVNILVSSHPEHAAIFWGSLRLILQVRAQFILDVGYLSLTVRV